MDSSAIFNLCEAFLWFLISIYFFLRRVSKDNIIGEKKIFIVLGVIFIFFGISDLIEMRTGAWWKPPALFLLKTACVISMIICFVLIHRKEINPKKTA